MIAGKNYLFRTVTMIYAGTLVSDTKEYYVIKNASWIADTGRWHDALKTCNFDEVEPYQTPETEVYVFKGGMLDIVEIDNVPTDQI